MNRKAGQASTLRSTATPVLRSSSATEDGEDGSCLPQSATPTGTEPLALARSPGRLEACPTLARSGLWSLG